MKHGIAGAAVLAAIALCGAGGAVAGQDLLREVLRQQSAAQREGCSAVKRVLATEPNAALVVRTAVEIGYNPCQVVRCAIEGDADLAQVIQGAGEAGVEADVVARCALEAGADAAAVAKIFSDIVFEPDFCYFTFTSPNAPVPQPPLQQVIERSYPPTAQASVYTF